MNVGLICQNFSNRKKTAYAFERQQTQTGNTLFLRLSRISCIFIESLNSRTVYEVSELGRTETVTGQGAEAPVLSDLL